MVSKLRAMIPNQNVLRGLWSLLKIQNFNRNLQRRNKMDSIFYYLFREMTTAMSKLMGKPWDKQTRLRIVSALLIVTGVTSKAVQLSSSPPPAPLPLPLLMLATAACSNIKATGGRSNKSISSGHTPTTHSHSYIIVLVSRRAQDMRTDVRPSVRQVNIQPLNLRLERTNYYSKKGLGTLK